MNRQPDLFVSEQLQEFFEDQPARAYSADPDRVRARLFKILAEARAAERLPWGAERLSLYRTISPQMTRWLSDQEGAQLCLEFEAELERLEAA